MKPPAADGGGKSLRSEVRTGGLVARVAIGIGIAVLVFAVIVARRDAVDRTPAPPIIASVDASADFAAWQSSYDPDRRGLLEPLEDRDLVLVRAPHDVVLRWFRARGANVLDDALGSEVSTGNGWVVLVGIRGHSWVVALAAAPDRVWPQQLSADLHALVFELADHERPRHYRWLDDGVVVEEFTSRDAGGDFRFVSTRRPRPVAIADEDAFVDATLRAIDVLAPPLRPSAFLSPLGDALHGGPRRVTAPVQEWSRGAVVVRRELPLRRCSFVHW